jgi:RimJ/RimL family protein N-acetyltransferase
MAKCGFQEEGLKRKGQLCHGTWHDLKLFGKILS